MRSLTPNDPCYSSGTLWHLHNTGQNSGVPDTECDSPEAWDTLTSAGNVIAVIVDICIRYAD